jgi:hypothetical protein
MPGIAQDTISSGKYFMTPYAGSTACGHVRGERKEDRGAELRSLPAAAEKAA